MEDLSTLLNLSRALGVDPDLEDGAAAWNRAATPAIEAIGPAYGSGCVFGSVADEWVPVRFPASRGHWM